MLQHKILCLCTYVNTSYVTNVVAQAKKMPKRIKKSVSAFDFTSLQRFYYRFGAFHAVNGGRGYASGIACAFSAGVKAAYLRLAALIAQYAHGR